MANPKFSCFEIGDGLVFDGRKLSATSVSSDTDAQHMADINLVHFYNIYNPDSGDVMGMRSSVDSAEIIKMLKKNKLVVGLNMDGVIKSPYFVYDFDKAAGTVNWYHFEVGKTLAWATFEQTGGDITRI